MLYSTEDEEIIFGLKKPSMRNSSIYNDKLTKQGTKLNIQYNFIYKIL